jgi:hypothetical protein
MEEWHDFRRSDKHPKRIGGQCPQCEDAATPTKSMHMQQDDSFRWRDNVHGLWVVSLEIGADNDAVQRRRR